MAVNVPWKELWQALKKDPLYSQEGFARRCIEELETGVPAEYQYLDDIEGPQAHLLHLLCDLGDLARLDNGRGKRDDAERLQYRVKPNLVLSYSSTFSAFAGEAIFMIDVEVLITFLRARRLPLPSACFPSEPDTTDMIGKLYREKFGDRPIYLDDVRVIMAQECEVVEASTISPKMARRARIARELTDAGKESEEVHYEIYGSSSADSEHKDRQVRKLLQIERELSAR